ncbi:MAG: peptidase M20, partial [Clostridia bacterium]
MKTSLKLISSALAVGAVANAAHAAVYKPKKNETVDIIKDTVDVEKYKAHLCEAIKIKTISHRDESQTDWAEFERFHAFLDASYPLIAEKLEKEVIPPANLLYRWKGKDSTLNPIALLAHQDVVPVSDGTEDDWVHPAF